MHSRSCAAACKQTLRLRVPCARCPCCRCCCWGPITNGDQAARASQVPYYCCCRCCCCRRRRWCHRRPPAGRITASPGRPGSRAVRAASLSTPPAACASAPCMASGSPGRASQHSAHASQGQRRPSHAALWHGRVERALRPQPELHTPRPEGCNPGLWPPTSPPAQRLPARATTSNTRCSHAPAWPLLPNPPGATALLSLPRDGRAGAPTALNRPPSSRAC